MSEPNWRTGVGVIVILTMIATWGFLVASLANTVGEWPVLVQALFYLVTGIIWIFPMKPVVRWMLTGRFRRD